MNFFVRALGVGLFSSSLVVAYRYVLKMVEKFRHELAEIFQGGISFAGGIGILVGGVMIALSLGKIMEKYPYVKGGGVSFVKGILKGTLSSNWVADVIFKFIGGILSLLGGLSMGIEGPAVQLGAQMAEGMSGKKLDEEDRRYLITAGSAAGFAAAFGAPLSAVIFAVEEFGKKISEKLLSAIFIAAVIGGGLSTLIFGRDYFFHPRLEGYFPVEWYFLIIVLGFFITGMGKTYIKISDIFGSFYKNLRIPAVWKPIFPVVLGIVATLTLYNITGGGHHMSEKVLLGEFTVEYLLILFVLKLLFSLFCSSSGIPGGVFIPIISIGLIGGKLFGTMMVNMAGVPPYLENYFAIMGFVAALSVLIRIPLTALSLAVETTGALEILMPALIVATSSHMFSKIFKIESIYDTGYKKLIKREEIKV